MTPECEQLHVFADGELPPAEADEFRLHLATCDRCQKELDDVIQLDALVESVPPATVTELRPRVRKRTVSYVIGGFAAAAAAVAVIAVLPRNDDPFALGGTRPFEARLTHEGAREYRPYDVPRSGAGSRQVPLETLARLEKQGDLDGLGTGYLLRGEREQALLAFAKAGTSPDLQSDRAVAALTAGKADEALLLLDGVLAASPKHPQALWNRALALRELQLPNAAAEAFTQAAALGEHGWAEEATARAAALREEARAAETGWKAAREAGLAMALQGTIPPVQLVRAVPGIFRLYLYDALRAAPSRERVEALKPVAAELGVDISKQLAADFTKRAPLAAEYAKVVAGDLRPVAALMNAPEADIKMGALFFGRAIGQHLEEYRKLAGDDPWFRAIAAQEAAEKAPSVLETERQLAAALRDAQEAHVDYRAVVIATRLTEVELMLHRLPEAWSVAQTAFRLARARGEWVQERQALGALAEAARFRGAYALARGYLREVLLRNPSDCRNQAWVHGSLADLAVLELKPAEARAEVDAMPSCGDPIVLRDAMVLADVSRLAPRADDLVKLRAALDARRKAGLTASDAALADHIEGRLLVERDRAAGKSLLEKAIREADALPREDVDAQRARGYSYQTLELDAARASDAAEMLRLLGAELRTTAPAKCAVGVAVSDERAAIAVRPAAGADLLWYDGARTQPMSAFAPQLTAQQLGALKGCEKVDVLARPPIHGRPRLLPNELAWSYRSGERITFANDVSRELVIADVEPPPGLGLPRLSPWTTTAAARGSRLELRGPAATPSRALAEMESAAVIEIHAHGLADAARADAAAIVLSTDASGAFALTARDVREHKLRAAPLVLLAACRTAEDTGALHAAWSLPEAFLEAGARAVLASAADIPDAEARQFFDGVRERIRKGADPAVALRDERMAWRGGRWVDDVLVFD